MESRSTDTLVKYEGISISVKISQKSFQANSNLLVAGKFLTLCNGLVMGLNRMRV